MKLTCVLLLSSIVAAPLAAVAQKPAVTKPHVATHATAGLGCVKMPALSPKIPALPVGAPCPKALYTLTTIPQVKVVDTPAALAASVRDYLGIEPVSFSLVYVDTKIGTGELAEPHKWYSVRYTGYLQDGTVFDASSKHPEQETFVLQQGAHGVIPGWDTGFYGMRVGGKRRLYIPHQLAYGPRQVGSIPPFADLVFDIELVSESDKDPRPAPKAPSSAATPSTPKSPSPHPTPAPGQPAAPTSTSPKPQ